MSSFHPVGNSRLAANLKSKKGSEEGKIYEKLSLALLAKSGYELSKEKSKFCNFAIGREVGLGKDGKFDDIVLSYMDQDNTKNLIFVQIKYKQDDYMIDSQVLSTEASKAKGGKDGGMRRDFNLQKYFISYLNVREELKHIRSKEFRSGKLKYVVIFTNVSLNTEELNDNGFSLKKAPSDIINIFSLKKPSTSAEGSSHCYQLGDVSEGLRKILKKSSDIHRLARELAQYVIWEDYRENKIMGIDESPIKHYHVALEREVIQKSDQVKNKSSQKQTRSEKYCEAQFRDEFVNSNKTGSKQELRNAMFQTIRELDTSKQVASDGELKDVLRKTIWKLVPNFGKSKQTFKTDLPPKWMTVNEEDIAEFLKCLVFIVDQPRIKELQELFRNSAQDTAVEGTLLREILNKIENTGPELRKRIEKVLEIDQKAKYKEKWITGEKILNFFEEQKRLINLSFFVIAMTLVYESEAMQFGKFNEFQKMEKCLENFLLNNAAMLFIKTTSTLLSSIKILQYLNTNKIYRSGDNRISISMDILRSEEGRESVAKAFEFENYHLLIVEYRHTVEEQDVENFYYKLFNIVNDNPKKKIIFIMPEDERCTILHKKFKIDFKSEGQFIMEKDFIDLKTFEPIDDPFKKNIIIFQGQKIKTSLATLSGINCWSSYVDYLSQEIFQKKQDIIDVKTLLKILNNEEIEVGSKPLGTSNLEGAYATLYEEINVESLANEILSQEHVRTGDIYIMTGIREFNQEKVEKLVQNLGLINDQENIKNHLRDIGSESIIQIADDQVKDEDFKRVCSDYPKKMIFWINIKDEENGSKFILQQFYDPKFYLKRKFQQVVIKKEVEEQLMKDCLSEIFIFHCVNDQEELVGSFNFAKKCELEKFENNCGNGKIVFLATEADAKAKFEEICKKNQIVHLLKFAERLIWCNSHGSLGILRNYIDYEQSKICLVEEDYLVKEIRDRKVVILADDPGMGKTTTLTKLYESNDDCESFIETHWVISVNLRDHLQAIRNIGLVNGNIDVVNFLSEMDLSLKDNLAKSLLRVALDKSDTIAKPLLLALDGFDEVLDQEDRNKIISLLKFLKDETSAKLWITTRRHYKKTLENELSTFAVEFDPMNDNVKEEYIEKYLKDRFHLILSQEKFAEIFTNNDEMQENRNIQKYTEAFLRKMRVVFEDNTFRFIGTPLQLYLMLEGSTNHFKCWTKNYTYQNPDFNYLGGDVREAYKKFIERKYNFYFKKMDIKGVRRKEDKYIFTQCSKNFAISLIIKSKPKKTLDKFKDVVLSAGIIKSHGINVEFIHTTFRDYFVAKACVDWIKKAPNILSNSNKQEYVLKEILKKPDYELVRTFINLKLKNAAESESFEESLKYYGMIIERLVREEARMPLIDYEDTILHIAVEEGNKNIVCFFLNSLKGHRDTLKEFLFTPNKDEQTALHLACRGDDDETVRVLLDAAGGISEDTKGQKNDLKKFLFTPDIDKHTALHFACRGDNDKTVRVLLDAAGEISEDTLQQFIYTLNKYKWNALHDAVLESNNVQIVKDLLERANNNLDLLVNKKMKRSSLCRACEFGKEEFVKTLLQGLENDKNSLKELLLFEESSGNALSYAVPHFTTIVGYLLSAAKSINDNNETLKQLLLPKVREFTLFNRTCVPLDKSVQRGNIYVVKILLNTAKDMDDDYLTLKQMLFHDVTLTSPLLVVLEYNDKIEYCMIMKLLLETAACIDNEILEKLIFAVVKSGKNAIEVINEYGYEKIFIHSLKIFEEHKYLRIRKNVIKLYNSVPLADRISFDKKVLLDAIRWGEITKVKDILDRAKNSKMNSGEKFRILLLAINNGKLRWNTLHKACWYGRTDVIKELITYAVEINDEGETLKELITTRNCIKKTPFEAIHPESISDIKEFIKRLILQARNVDNEHVLTVLLENQKFEELNYIEGFGNFLPKFSPTDSFISAPESVLQSSNVFPENPTRRSSPFLSQLFSKFRKNH